MSHPSKPERNHAWHHLQGEALQDHPQCRSLRQQRLQHGLPLCLLPWAVPQVLLPISCGHQPQQSAGLFGPGLFSFAHRHRPQVAILQSLVAPSLPLHAMPRGPRLNHRPPGSRLLFPQATPLHIQCDLSLPRCVMAFASSHPQGRDSHALPWQPQCRTIDYALQQGAAAYHSQVHSRCSLHQTARVPALAQGVHEQQPCAVVSSLPCSLSCDALLETEARLPYISRGLLVPSMQHGAKLCPREHS
mmetsp:Transcript_77678/g.150076  ORF Transcript_77678/g.150076 Transcript_77678/m.150076 type:complete len:246 (+) Transcript_77678:875-1612(+)